MSARPVASAGHAVLTATKLVLGFIAVAVFGAGIPLLWVWVGSQLQGGTAPSLSGLGVTLIGIVGSYAGLVVAMAWLKERNRPTDDRPVRYAWNRSLSAERHQVGRTTPLEDIVVAATLIVGVICTGWFLLFGSPGVPAGY
jgi:hypothetical protein